jgi:hypothetical protein
VRPGVLVADRVAHLDDLELALTKHVRASLAAHQDPVCAGVVVSNREPSAGTPQPTKLVVIRDDSGPDLSVVTAERAIGVTTLLGTKEQPQDAKRLAGIVHAIMRGAASLNPANPVAAVTASNGPYPVVDPSLTYRLYSTFTLIVVGQPY